MGKINKVFSLFLVVILAVSSLMMVESTSAQAIIKPSIPEFTAEYVDHSYTVPARTHTEPYTGEQVTDPSYMVQNETIDITIKNQPYVSTEDIAYLCYNIREKGHFEDIWTELGHITNKTNDNALFRATPGSEYKIISLPKTAQNGGQIDFQVKAYFTVGHRFFNTNFGTWTWEESDWSNTQTVTIPETSATPSPNPTLTSTPTVPEFSLWVILPFFVSLLLVAVYLRHRRTNHE